MTPQKAPQTPQLHRLPTWRGLHSGWLHSVRGTPFNESNHACALFAAGAVQAMTGVDFAAPYRGRYTTPRGAGCGCCAVTALMTISRWRLNRTGFAGG